MHLHNGMNVVQAQVIAVSLLNDGVGREFKGRVQIIRRFAIRLLLEETTKEATYRSRTTDNFSAFGS